MQCPNCSHEADATEFGEPQCCPACGAYYEKALLARARRNGEAFKTEQGPKGRDLAAGLVATGKTIDKGLRAAVELVTPAPKAHNALSRYGKYYCPSCGQVGNGTRHVPGSILIEIVLWFCFLLPGLIYSIWRHAAACKACSMCKHPGLIPVNSPRAKRELGI